MDLVINRDTKLKFLPKISSYSCTDYHECWYDVIMESYKVFSYCDSDNIVIVNAGTIIHVPNKHPGNKCVPKPLMNTFHAKHGKLVQMLVEGYLNY